MKTIVIKKNNCLVQRVACMKRLNPYTTTNWFYENNTHVLFFKGFLEYLYNKVPKPPWAPNCSSSCSWMYYNGEHHATMWVSTHDHLISVPCSRLASQRIVLDLL